MALGNQPQLYTHGKIEFINGSGTTYEAVTDEGDLKVSGLGRRFNAPVRVERRGRKMGTGYGARRYPQMSLTEKILNQTAAAAPGSLRDFLTGTGPYAGEIGTLGAGQTYTVDVRHTAESSNFGGTDDVNLWEDVDFNSHDFAEGEPNTFAFNGEVLGPHSLNGNVVGREITQGGG